MDPLDWQHAGSLAARRLHVSTGIVNDRFADSICQKKWGEKQWADARKMATGFLDKCAAEC